MTKSLIQLTPDLASRIIQAFGDETEIGAKSPSDLIQHVEWYAMNELESDFMEANPNAYEFDYLKQFFATMILEEQAQDSSLAGSQIESNLATIWTSIQP